MRLLHYSAAPFTFDPLRIYEEHPYGFKPTGLWLSVEGDDDWRGWCEGERFGLERLTHAVEVTLKPGTNVLVIDTAKGLHDFDARFRLTEDPHDLRNIDWPKVKAAYDGLIIAPYQWEHRLGMMWYYGWDCASGVIWNLSAVSEVLPSAASSSNTPEEK